jgi:hypothetical protein
MTLSQLLQEQIKKYDTNCNHGTSHGGFLTNPNGKLDEERVKSFLSKCQQEILENVKEEVSKVMDTVDRSDSQANPIYDYLTEALENNK